MFQILFLWIHLAHAQQLVSPFPSEVKGISIPNAHQVDTKIIRAMMPRNQQDARQIRRFGLQHVLVFKNSYRGDHSLAEERELFAKEGFLPNQIKVIPFRWRDTKSFRVACLQTLQALRYLKHHQANGVFFHCTVGEDRTGFLAGLYDILFLNVKPKIAWKQEMCENGYAGGNPQKPAEVVALVKQNISPTFQKLVYKIRQGQLSAKHLENSACDEDPSLLSSYQEDPAFNHCEPSSKYEKPKEKNSQRD